ncbi:putative KHA domain-containing protein [Helianthus annuus]|nr:putative KHA domain-containing protein [Helianthus annuus]KAJ0431978.1 putative KHA domain-containing protein [Helianthus annuus]KAJ0635147.1 putative KHA domain-containing protein [Helianthus annuus]
MFQTANDENLQQVSENHDTSDYDQEDTPITNTPSRSSPSRVIIHAHKPHEERPETGKVVQLPGSVSELLELAEKKLGKRGSVILMEDGSQVEDLEALRDNDHLFIF